MIVFLKTSNKDAESSGKTSSVAIDSSKAAIRVEVIEKTGSTYLILTATTEETAEYPKYEGVTYTKTVDVWLSNTTALGRIPFAAGQLGEFDA